MAGKAQQLVLTPPGGSHSDHYEDREDHEDGNINEEEDEDEDENSLL